MCISHIWVTAMVSLSAAITDLIATRAVWEWEALLRASF